MFTSSVWTILPSVSGSSSAVGGASKMLHRRWVPNQHIRLIYEGSCDTEDRKISVAITGIN